MLDAAAVGDTALLIAPTGGGKTLSGFLPSLVDLAANPRPGIHTLYVSPLKALGTDVARNLLEPVAEMALPVTVETRSGDTPQSRRARQKETPPNILLTTPESLALLVSQPTAPDVFGGLRCVVIDEVHALAGTKRGDQLALCLARLKRLAPGARRTGLSATVAYQDAITEYVGCGGPVRLVEVAEGAPPDLEIRLSEDRVPWSGRMGLASAAVILERIAAAGMSIVFVNTRAQGELLFQALWKLNEATLPIALHHGSLDINQRRRVEAAMARGDLRAVVATALGQHPRDLPLGMHPGRHPANDLQYDPIADDQGRVGLFGGQSADLGVVRQVQPGQQRGRSELERAAALDLDRSTGFQIMQHRVGEAVDRERVGQVADTRPKPHA